VTSKKKNRRRQKSSGSIKKVWKKWDKSQTKMPRHSKFPVLRLSTNLIKTAWLCSEKISSDTNTLSSPQKKAKRSSLREEKESTPFGRMSGFTMTRTAALSSSTRKKSMIKKEFSSSFCLKSPKIYFQDSPLPTSACQSTSSWIRAIYKDSW
jgi:hypothetical protein